MRRILFFLVLITVYVAVTIVPRCRGSAEEIRVWGGKLEDFKDSDGRIWHGGQNEKEKWGRMDRSAALRIAEVRNLTKDAQKLAKKEGYDEELFYAVSWAKFPDVVKVDLNTG